MFDLKFDRLLNNTFNLNYACIFKCILIVFCLNGAVRMVNACLQTEDATLNLIVLTRQMNWIVVCDSHLFTWIRNSNTISLPLIFVAFITIVLDIGVKAIVRGHKRCVYENKYGDRNFILIVR